MAQTQTQTLEKRLADLEAQVLALRATNWTERASATTPDGEHVPLSVMATAPAAAEAAQGTADTAQQTADGAVTAAGDASTAAASAQQTADDAAAAAAQAVADAAAAAQRAQDAEDAAGAVSGDVAAAQQAADDAAGQAAAALTAAQNAQSTGTSAQQQADLAAAAAVAAQEAADAAGTAAAQADADAAAAAATAAQAVADAAAAADAASAAQGTANTAVTAAGTAQTTAGNAGTAAAAAQQAADAALTAQSITRNSTFSQWPGTHPTFWYTWSATAPTKETATVRTAPHAVRWNVGAVDAGMAEGNALDDLPLGLEYVTVELDFLLASGSLTGAGVLLDWEGMTNNRALLNLATEVPAPSLNRWHRVTKVLRRPTNATGTHSSWGGYLMANWVGLGALTAKNVVFDRIAFRPATAEEVTAYGTPAQITTLTTNVGTAQTTANNALTSANGKNRFWAQATAPTPAVALIAGDVWIDTANGRRINVHSGSAWVQQLLSTGALTAIVASDVLVSGSVLAAQLHADSINGKTITGATLRTAASGQRVQIDSTNGLVGYNSAGTILTQVGTDGILRAVNAILSGTVTVGAGTNQGVKITSTAGTAGGGAVQLWPRDPGVGGTDLPGLLEAGTDTGGILTRLSSPPKLIDSTFTRVTLRSPETGVGDGYRVDSIGDIRHNAGATGTKDHHFYGANFTFTGTSASGRARFLVPVANMLKFGNASSFYSGVAPPTDAEFLFKTWTGNLVSSAFGDNTIFWPGSAFPNGVLYAEGAVDGNGGQRIQLWGLNKTQTNVRFLNGNGTTATNQTWYVSILAIGY